MSIFDQDQCQVYWGSHGCSRPRGHDGDHWCQGADESEPHHTINAAGVAPNGYQWDMYGDDVVVSEDS